LLGEFQGRKNRNQSAASPAKKRIKPMAFRKIFKKLKP
jgi:hypothetical protein